MAGLRLRRPAHCTSARLLPPLQATFKPESMAGSGFFVSRTSIRHANKPVQSSSFSKHWKPTVSNGTVMSFSKAGARWPTRLHCRHLSIVVSPTPVAAHAKTWPRFHAGRWAPFTPAPAETDVAQRKPRFVCVPTTSSPHLSMGCRGTSHNASRVNPVTSLSGVATDWSPTNWQSLWTMNCKELRRSYVASISWIRHRDRSGCRSSSDTARRTTYTFRSSHTLTATS